jgi:short-subunit dehydrogenase
MEAENFSEKYGPWALVTGAAEGLGAEFARQVAATGIATVLVDVQIEKARAQAEAIAREFGVETRAIECDLADPSFMSTLEGQVSDIEVGLLICCAGYGTVGPFLSTPLETMKRMTQINCTATLELSHHCASAMAERGRGGIILIASTSAYAGAPYVANYAATKAYDLSLGEALWYELAPHGIDVLAFSPQGTNTPGFRRGMPSLKEGETMEGVMLPSEAVEVALGGLGRLASLRPDLPESTSEKRQEIIHLAGEFMKHLAPSSPS